MAKTSYTLRTPKYYKSFRCIGGECLDSCCCNWNTILWTDSEYDKLMNSQMSDGLREKLSKAFVRDNDHWNIDEIQNEKTGRRSCPLITEEGLCAIQKELGAEYLSHTCMIFPRDSCFSMNQLTMSCTGACPEIINILLNDRDAMKLSDSLKTYTEDIGSLTSHDTPEAIDERTFLEYRNIMMDFFYSLISDERYSPETGIILASIAAKKLSELYEYGEERKIPDEIGRLKKLLGDESQIAQVNAIKPNYIMKLGIVGTTFLDITNGVNLQNIVFTLCDENNSFRSEKYIQGEQALRELFAGREYFMRNLYLNMLLELNAEVFKLADTIYDFWLFYCISCSMLKLIAVSASLIETDTENILIKNISALFRRIGHAHGFYKLILNKLKESGYTKTAHIALMLK